MDLEAQTFLIQGPEDFVVAAMQQLTWLAAACRASQEGVAYCFVGYTDLTATNSDDSTPTFRVDFEVTPIEPEAAGQKYIGSCWKGIIGSSVLVWGFPIAPRSSDHIGLELSVEVMAALADIPFFTKHEDGFVLKGWSHAFIPVQRKNDSVQWHMIEKLNGRIQFDDIEKNCSSRLCVHELNEDELFTTRAILGWCPDSVNNFGALSLSHFLLVRSLILSSH